MVKAVKKVAQGPARDEGKTWFIQLISSSAFYNKEQGVVSSVLVSIYCKSHNVSGPFILARLAVRPFSLR